MNKLRRNLLINCSLLILVLPLTIVESRIEADPHLFARYSRDSINFEISVDKLAIISDAESTDKHTLTLRVFNNEDNEVFKKEIKNDGLPDGRNNVYGYEIKWDITWVETGEYWSQAIVWHEEVTHPNSNDILSDITVYSNILTVNVRNPIERGIEEFQQDVVDTVPVIVDAFLTAIIISIFILPPILIHTLRKRKKNNADSKESKIE